MHLYTYPYISTLILFLHVRSVYTVHTHHICYIYVTRAQVLYTHSSICGWIIYSIHYPQLLSVCYTDWSHVFNRRDEQHKALLSWAGLDLGTEQMGIRSRYFWCWTTTFQSPTFIMAKYQHEISSTRGIYVRVWDCEFGYGSGCGQDCIIFVCHSNEGLLFSFFFFLSSLRRCISGRNVNVSVIRPL